MYVSSAATGLYSGCRTDGNVDGCLPRRYYTHSGASITPQTVSDAAYG